MNAVSSAFEIRTPTLLDKARSRALFFKNYTQRHLSPAPTAEQTSIIDTLRREGSVILDGFIQPDQLKTMQVELQQALDKLRFSLPCLAQTRIDPVKHRELIDNFMFGTPKQLRTWGVTFNREEARDYEQVLRDFNPSTLSLPMLELSSTYRAVWLHPFLLGVIANYMGLVPRLAEAYVRRNFPAPYRTMNHFWHRDLNSQHLLKVFFFLSDCKVESGPHEYVKQSHVRLDKLNNKRYFEDHEVDALHPPGSSARFLSVVRAGTVVIEDTRGLHRANLPIAGHRDLGFAVFMPLRPFYPYRNYHFPPTAMNELTAFQRAFIPPVMHR